MEDIRTTGGISAPSRPWTGTVSVVGAGMLWGTGGLTGALLSGRSGLEPFAVAGYRLAIGGALIVGWLLVTGRAGEMRCGPAGHRRLLTLGVLAAWFQVWYFLAVELTTVSLATLVTLGSAPVLVVVAESVAARRWPARRTLAATTVAVAGLALLTGGPGGGDGHVALAGGGCALASAAGFAAITMLGARPVAGLAALPTVGLAFCVGGAITLPIAATIGTVTIEPQVQTWALLAFLGLVPTALAYLLYFTGLRSVPAGSAALISLLEPLTASVLGGLLLHERLGGAGLAGAGLIGIAVLMTSVQRNAG